MLIFTHPQPQNDVRWRWMEVECVSRVDMGVLVPFCLQVCKHMSRFCPDRIYGKSYFILHLHLSVNHKGRWGTTDNFTTSFLHFSLFSTALWDFMNSRPVHSLMLSSHLFLCPPGPFPHRGNCTRRPLLRSTGS